MGQIVRGILVLLLVGAVGFLTGFFFFFLVRALGGA